MTLRRQLRRALRVLGLEQAADRVHSILRRSSGPAIDPVEFERRYAAVDTYELALSGGLVRFSTRDQYSKRWFFPRYDDGRIHEEPVTRLFIDSLNAARCIADVGAHLGWFSCIAGVLRPEATVHAFEMDADNAAILRRNIALNDLPNVVLVDAAVSANPGTVVYHRQSSKPNPELRLDAPSEHADGKSIAVPALSLDSYFAAERDQPDIIKIDVEGAELEVLKGAASVIEMMRPTLFIEVHPRTMKSFGATPADVVQFLADREYQVFEIVGLRTGVGGGLLPLTMQYQGTENTMLYARARDA